MSLRFRRLLYIFFILAFLIITPLLCLYAAGYKISPNLKIKKTGILIIDSEPGSAKIYLNNKPQQLLFSKILNQKNNIIKTPAKIKNLLPGEYNIRIELENYWPWQKKLTIRSGESTFAEDIILFKKDLPSLILDDNFHQTSISPSAKHALALNNDKITLINLNNDHKNEYIVATSAKSDLLQENFILWNKNENQVIINNLIFNTNNWSQPTKLTDLIKNEYEKGIEEKFLKTKWDESGSKLYFIQKNDLLSINFDSKKLQTIVSSNGIYDFLVKDKLVFLLQKNHEKNSINIYDAEKKEYTKKINIPFSDYQFINPESPWLNLYDEKFNILYLIDPFSSLKPLRDTIANVINTFWKNDNLLLYSDGFEIWLYDVNGHSKILLTRVSKEINNIFMPKNDNYVIYTTNKAINVIELDDREKRNITEIISLKELKDPFIDRAGELIYFYAQIGNQSGLYKLAL